MISSYAALAWERRAERAGGMRAPLRTIGIGAERHTAVGAGSTDLLARGSAPEQRGALRDRRVPPS
jgi:hypothetical protein